MIYTVEYKGKEWVSVNTFYTMHYHQKTKVKNNWKAYWLEQFKAVDMQPFQAFTLTLNVNSRHDIDGHASMCKVFVDTLTINNYIKNDTREHFKGLTIVPNTSLEKNTFQFKLYTC